MNKNTKTINTATMKAKNIFGENVVVEEMKILKESEVWHEMSNDEIVITRTPIINIIPSLTDKPNYGWDDQAHEDRWDEYKENYMAEAEGYVEPYELP